MKMINDKYSAAIFTSELAAQAFINESGTTSKDFYTWFMMVAHHLKVMKRSRELALENQKHIILDLKEMSSFVLCLFKPSECTEYVRLRGI